MDTEKILWNRKSKQSKSTDNVREHGEEQRIHKKRYSGSLLGSMRQRSPLV